MTGPRQAASPELRFNGYAEFYKNSAYGSFSQEHRVVGSFSQTLVMAHQGPIDLIDSPVPEYAFGTQLTAGKSLLVDLGEGVREHRRFPAGALQITPPDNATRWARPDDHTVLFMAMPKTIVSRILDEAGVTGEPFGNYYGGVTDAPEQCRLPVCLLKRMWSTAQHKEARSALYLDGLTLQLLAVVAGSSELSPLGGSGAEDARISRAVDYIEADLGKTLTVAEIAAVACLSPGHFARCFKATTGEPVWTYVQRRRGERAKELLQTTNLPVAEIAYVCGFANQSHLTSCFKQQFGMTPAHARRGALL